MRQGSAVKQSGLGGEAARAVKQSGLGGEAVRPGPARPGR